MIIKILGPGCASCAAMEDAVHAALARLGLRATIGHVTDYAQIAAFGVLNTPALVVDERLLVAGRVPAADDVAELLAGHLARQDVAR
ncbi:MULTISPECIES: thioredoxin family protein [Catenuloplanes]|uniref:Small redox-active disulfide protein 2 n=1 Tax=Catenuloplanes niger TaxID=587534 RepID=A0AAE4A1R0_9ACTN|nr:thioredoxin family protein [Catenuloplanes niger]MDR7327645.1 small redox-active disulfide protein 2 [Catenuloplanes niger]